MGRWVWFTRKGSFGHKEPFLFTKRKGSLFFLVIRNLSFLSKGKVLFHKGKVLFATRKGYFPKRKGSFPKRKGSFWSKGKVLFGSFLDKESFFSFPCPIRKGSFNQWNLSFCLEERFLLFRGKVPSDGQSQRKGSL